jgi:hypothetical protein
MPKIEHPYLTIVATSRNDNHGKHMTQRMQLFVRGLLYQTKRVGLPVELIIVEWNPPVGKPLLKEILPHPQAGDLLHIRYLIVPPELHQGYRFADRIPLFQMIAKNVGIRRAKGQFVLCTNVDLLFSNELFDFLGKHSLMTGYFYRCNRCDIPGEIPFDLPVAQLLESVHTTIISRIGKHHMERNGSDSLWQQGTNRPVGLMQFLHYGLSYLRVPTRKNKKRSITELDTEACGDFTLMAREDWLRIKGYLELEAYSIHIDSLGLYAAVAQDIQQIILPPAYCSYHVSHEDGWEQGDPVRKLLKDIERPMIQWNTMERLGNMLINKELELDLNKENWGLADVHLEEYNIHPPKE